MMDFWQYSIMAKKSDFFAGSMSYGVYLADSHLKTSRWTVTSDGKEKFCSAHSAFPTDGTDRDIDPANPEQLLLPGFLAGRFFCLGYSLTEERTAYRDGVFAVSVCQKAEVTYSDIPSGQNMKKESSDKLVCLKRHGLLTITVGIIPPEKRDVAITIGKDAVIADGDPVGISAEVLKDAFGAVEGRLAIDNPLLVIELFPEDSEVFWFLEVTDTAGKDKTTSFEAMGEVVKELTAEQCRHDPYGKEEALAA